jgi:hypothetical protein
MKLTIVNSHFLILQENCILPVVVDVWLGFCGIKCEDCKRRDPEKLKLLTGGRVGNKSEKMRW